MIWIWIPAVVLASVGLAVAITLVIAARAFKVEGAEVIEDVNDQLPGVNCGACGFPGCMGYAEAIVKDDAPPDKCVPGGPDIVPRIHAVLGEGELAHAEMGSGTADVVIAHDPWPVKSEPAISNVAFVACGGGNNVKYRYNYVGLATCAAADQVGGGFKECYTACQGLGDCVRACQFDAMSIIDGIAVVETEKCTGCSLCVPACPKNLISMVPGNAAVVVRCSNRLKGKSVSTVCDVGCIACNKCQKNCPSEAFTVRDSLAEVDYGKCTGQLVCVSDCPANCLFEGPAAPYAAAMSPQPAPVAAAADEG